MNQVFVISHERGKMPTALILEAKIAQVLSHPNITVFTDTVIEEVNGYIGNYTVKLRRGMRRPPNLRHLHHRGGYGHEGGGTCDQFEYGNDPRVVTQLQLERLLAEKAVKDFKECGNHKLREFQERGPGLLQLGLPRGGQERICPEEAQPGSRVHVLYRDLSLVREEHFHLDAAKAEGIKFIRFPDDQYPKVTRDNRRLKVQVRDILLGRDLIMPADLLVLTTAFQGDSTVGEIKGHLKVSANSDSFFQEAHVKLGPVDFAADGISLAGCARSPKTFKESCEEGIAAAMRASIPMNRGYIEAEGIVADIDVSECNLCGHCHRRCPYSAIRVSENKEPTVIKALCKGCGLCAADCPKECITIIHFSDQQIMAQVEAALAEQPEQKIVGFVCHWCALGGVDMAGVSRLQYPPHARLIRVMCSAACPTRWWNEPSSWARPASS